MSSVLRALALRKAQSELQNQAPPSPTSEETPTPVKRRLQESIEVALTWSNRIEPKRRVLLNAMVPQVVRMVASEDPEKLARFVAKTMGLCAYILEGDGAVIEVAAYEMPREDDASEPIDSDADRLRSDLSSRAGEGVSPGGDGLGQDDDGGESSLRLLQSLPEIADPDLGLEAQV